MDYRFADSNDLNLLAEWNYQLIRDEGHRNSMICEQLRMRMQDWLKGEYKAILFSINDEPVAYALYKEFEQEVYLRQFFVCRDHRRHGLGKQCLAILRKHIWPSSKRLTLEVLVANEAAIKFWRSVGYKDYALTLEIMPNETADKISS
jgi:predicted acetyltransferase